MISKKTACNAFFALQAIESNTYLGLGDGLDKIHFLLFNRIWL